jgi:hypothetical protein
MGVAIRRLTPSSRHDTLLRGHGNAREYRGDAQIGEPAEEPGGCLDLRGQLASRDQHQRAQPTGTFEQAA